MTNLTRLWQARELLYMLTWRDISIKYKQSVMGFLWAILMPALIVAAGALVRIAAAEWSGQPVNRDDIANVMVKAVVWAFVVGAIRFGTNSLTGNSNLVSKIAFPKETFPLAAVISTLADFAVSLVALAVGLIAIGWLPTWHALLAIPIVVVTISLTTGLALFLSASNLFFRDVKYLVEIFLTYAIFFTPVLYEVRMLGSWKDVILLNPFAPLLEGLSAVLVQHQLPDPMWLGYSTVFAVIALVGGYWVFKRLETKFAESI